MTGDIMRFNIDKFNINAIEHIVETDKERLINEKLDNASHAKQLNHTISAAERIGMEAKSFMFSLDVAGSSFNIGSFNGMCFNTLPDKYRYFDSRIIINESITSIAGAARIFSRSLRCKERLNHRLSFSTLMMRSRKIFEAVLHEPMELLALYFHKVNANENMPGIIHFGKKIYVPVSLNERIENDGHVGKYFYLENVMTEKLNGSSHSGKIMWHESDLHEILISFLRLALRGYQTFFLNTEMPLGSEIRIDSNNFTVFLNNMGQTINLRSKFNGDWIHFDRDTQRLYLGSEGELPLEGDVIYNDRWL